MLCEAVNPDVFAFALWPIASFAGCCCCSLVPCLMLESHSLAQSEEEEDALSITAEVEERKHIIDESMNYSLLLSFGTTNRRLYTVSRCCMCCR